MENGDPVTVYRQFLETFSIKIDSLCQEEFETPFRLSNSSLVPSELEGECLEWIRRVLLLHECPYGLISQLARAVLKNFLSVVNLTDFYLESDGKGSDDNDDDNVSNPSSDEDHIENSNIIQLSCTKILPELISHIHSTVKTWSVAPPVFSKPPVKFHVCSHAIKNTRRKMEDRHVVLTDLNVLFDLKDSPSQSYFAIFDGHGGLEAADYAAKHFHCHLVADENFNLDPAQALIQAYKSTDVRFLEKAKREGLRSGTTGITVFIRESKMYVGWLGDSQAILVRAGQAIQVMNPHKPEREDERRRIEELGGCVMFFGAWRVNGNISVSRAIGDAPHKPFICNDADVTTLVMNGEEEYLVLACDGLWDVMSPSQVTEIVYKHSNSSPGGLEDVAIGLVNAARDLGSSDNISVIVVLFKSSLSKPQPSQESDFLFNFQDISGNNVDNFSSSSTMSSNGRKESKLNERLKFKPSQGGNGDSLVSLDGSSSYHSNVRDSGVDGGVNGGGSYISHSWSGQNRTITTRAMEPPISNELVRQALFYVSPREDARLMTLALSKAIKGEKQDRKKRGREASDNGRGYSRQSSFSKSPRRPSVRTLSKVSQLNSSRSKGKGHRGSSKDLKARSRRKSGNRHILNETTWAASDDTDEDDRSSIDSHSLSTSFVPTIGSQRMLSSFHGGMSHLQPHTGRSEPGSLHLTGSQFAMAALDVSPWGTATKSLPQLSGKSLNLGNRNILPGIIASKSGGKKTAVVNPISKDGKALSVLGEEGCSQRPKLGRGSSVMSDSFAITGKGNNKTSLSLSQAAGKDAIATHLDLHSSKHFESGAKTSRQGTGTASHLSSYKWGRSN